MTFEMYDQLVDACDAVDADRHVQVMVLSGAGGRAFVAGTDINQFTAFQTGDDGVEYERRIDSVLDRLEAVRKPTVAFVEGVAMGSGFAIAAACDLRVITADATFGMPIARTVGNCLSMANYVRLAQAVGAARLKDIIFTARVMEAEEAREIGFVSAVVETDEADDTLGSAVRAAGLALRDDAVGDQGGAAPRAGGARGRRPDPPRLLERRLSLERGALPRLSGALHSGGGSSPAPKARPCLPFAVSTLPASRLIVVSRSPSATARWGRWWRLP